MWQTKSKQKKQPKNLWKSQVWLRFKLIRDKFFMISISKIRVPLQFSGLLLYVVKLAWILLTYVKHLRLLYLFTIQYSPNTIKSVTLFDQKSYYFRLSHVWAKTRYILYIYTHLAIQNCRNFFINVSNFTWSPSIA